MAEAFCRCIRKRDLRTFFDAEGGRLFGVDGANGRAAVKVQRRKILLPKRVAALFDNPASRGTDRSLPEVLDADKLQILRLVLVKRFGTPGIKSTHRVGAVNRLPVPAAFLFPAGLFQQIVFVQIFYEILKRSVVFIR